MGCVLCPSYDCKCKYDMLNMYFAMNDIEKRRFRTLLSDLLGDLPMVKQLRQKIQDGLTLKCPTCKTPVDPYPDACSAVMCLNCGNHYCNCCFQAFATGAADRDRAAAHRHAAEHNNAETPEARDSFLPAEVVSSGQKSFRISQIIAILKPHFIEEQISSIRSCLVAIFLCWSDFVDLHIDVQLIWNALCPPSSAISHCLLNDDVSCQSISNSSPSSSGNESSESDDYKDDSLTEFRNSVEPSEIVSSSRTRTRPALRARRKRTLADPAAPPNTSPLQSRQSRHPRHRNESSSPVNSNGSGRLLANAIITNNSQASSQIMESFPEGQLEVDFVDERHGHPLASLAILAGQPKLARMLLEKGANPLVFNIAGRSILYIATESGLDEIVDVILRRSQRGQGVCVDLNQPTTNEVQKYYPIHVASRYNHAHLIRLLVQYGAHVDPIESEHGYTPLMLALVLGNEAAASELILAGANVRYVASNGRTPMFVAAEKGLISILNLMISHCRVDINDAVVLPTGLRLLHVAAFHKKNFVVSHLIRLGADLNTRDEGGGGYTPLEMAIFGSNVEAALELIQAGCDVDLPSASGRYPLYFAIEKGLQEVIRAILLKSRRDINLPVSLDPTGFPPLHMSILHGQLQMLLPSFLALGVDIHRPDPDRGLTPVLMAVWKGDLSAVSSLLQAGADVNSERARTPEGRSALGLAIDAGNSGMIDLLVHQGRASLHSLVSERDPSLGYPLHFAISREQLFLVRLLLDLGADPFVRDTLGRSAMDMVKCDVGEENSSSYHLFQVLRSYAPSSTDSSFAVDSAKVPYRLSRPGTSTTRVAFASLNPSISNSGVSRSTFNHLSATNNSNSMFASSSAARYPVLMNSALSSGGVFGGPHTLPFQARHPHSIHPIALGVQGFAVQDGMHTLPRSLPVAHNVQRHHPSVLNVLQHNNNNGVLPNHLALRAAAATLAQTALPTNIEMNGPMEFSYVPRRNI